AFLASLPALALAQTGALDAARGARETSNAANAAIEARADAALAPEPVAAPVPDEVAIDVGADAVPPEGTLIAPAEAGAAVPPPDAYTVRPGDTLWDLSGRFLSSPWYWPKLWSYNPEITNPHWIYPGNLLRVAPGSAEGPALAEELEDFPEDLEAPRELEDFSRAELGAAADDDSVAVAGPYKIGYVAPRALLVRHDSFVTRRQLEESGDLAASFDEKRMLSTLDEAYARFKTKAPVKAGETYVLYKTSRSVHHPVTGELLGWQSEVVGAARVVRVDDKAATVMITQAFDPIERGTLLGPWNERLVGSVARRANARSLDGRIVAAQVEVVTQVG
ncbi:MAG TPA: LysM domain-containing protein, partial [Anaeromyxobacteraceae bacterium]|nr:LysM domain-containing protein [Anaeromyxobacteraceae bacterium]